MSGISTRKTVNKQPHGLRDVRHTLDWGVFFGFFLVLVSLFSPTPGRMRYLFVEPVACHDSFTI